jgi:3',5'-cyclic-AMP phosphodiesterase
MLGKPLAQNAPLRGKSQDRLRVLHLSDLHLQNARGAEAKFLAFSRELGKIDPGPDLMIFSGDFVMNTVSAGHDRAVEQWDVWDRAKAALPSIPFLASLGNQDVWGWNKKDSGCTGREPQYGKRLALDRLGLESSFGAYDLGAWRFIVLDPMIEGGRYGFTPRLDSAQFEFLVEELDRNEVPTMILCHIPLLPSPADFLTMGLNEPNSREDWLLAGNQVMQDGYRLFDLFRSRPHVKAYLSGHTHIRQKVEIEGLTLLTAPAVSGAWWRGDHCGSAAGYAILDLYRSGEFDYQFRDVVHQEERLEITTAS